MALKNIGHREARTLNFSNVSSTLFRLLYDDLCLPIDCSYLEDYLQPNCSAFNKKFKMTSIIFGHREPRTLDTRNFNTTLYLLRYGDLCLTIDCSCSKDFLQPNCSAYNDKFKMASINIGHREARTLDLSNVRSTI